MFKPVPELSLYASYGTSSNPPGANSGLGGYSYLDAMTMAPRHSFTLWTSYDVLPQVNVGAGVTMSSLVYASVSAGKRSWMPGYAKFDAAATWHATKNLDLQLNINNIFDKQYYQAAYPIYATWAPGRSVVLTMNLSM